MNTISLGSIADDIRFGLRIFAKNRQFVFVVILTLALGIGATTAIFSVVNAVLVRELPFKDPDRVVSVMTRRPNLAQAPLSLPDFLDYRNQHQGLEQVAGLASWGANITGQGETEHVDGVLVSGNTFELLGVQALLGRTLLTEDDSPDHPLVVVITSGLWERRFGKDPKIIGRKIDINSEPYTVVGVLPANFIFPYYHAEIARALKPDSDPRRADRSSESFLRGIGRLKPGVSPALAQLQLTAIAQRLRDQYPKFNANRLGITVSPIRDLVLKNFQLILWVLSGAVVLVLMIACTNMASLVLSKTVERYPEISVRIALGATRLRILQQLLAENILLSVCGGAAGFLVAMAAIPQLLKLTPANLPRLNEVAVDGRVLMFTIVVSVLCGTILGLIPGLQLYDRNLTGALKEMGKGVSMNIGRKHLRGLLVVLEVGLSLVLLISAGLLMKSLLKLQQTNPGFVPDHVLVAKLSLPEIRYKTLADILPFAQEAELRLNALPGVRSVGMTSNLPMSGLLGVALFKIVGRPSVSSEHIPSTGYRIVGPQYFDAMQIPILTGRTFTPQDTHDKPGVAIINETMARRYWPAGDAVGTHLTLDDAEPMRTVEVVGVAADVHHKSLDAEPESEIFIPMKQTPPDTVPWITTDQFWVLKSAGDPEQLAQETRNIFQSLDRNVATDIKPLNDYLATSLAPRRFNLLLIGIFAGAALLLTVIGVYGIMANLVTRRRREIGIRMTLGARRADIAGLIVLQGLKLVAIGVAVGLAVALAASRLLSSLLFHVSPEDPLTYGALVLVIMAVAVIACSVPAFRAMRINPIDAIREQ